MTLATDRAVIAAALDAITGVQGFTSRPTVSNTGDAFLLWGGNDRAIANDFEVTWKVIVTLPEGEEDAMTWVTDMLDDITDALSQIGYVERIEPGNLQTEAGTRDCMILTLRKEA